MLKFFFNMNWIYNIQAFIWMSLSFFSAISGLHLLLHKRMVQESKVVIYLRPRLAIATKWITRRNTGINWDEHTKSATANWWNRDAIDWWYFKGERSSWHFPPWRSGFRKRTRRRGKQQDKHWTGPPYTCKNKHPRVAKGATRHQTRRSWFGTRTRGRDYKSGNRRTTR